MKKLRFLWRFAVSNGVQKHTLDTAKPSNCAGFKKVSNVSNGTTCWTLWTRKKMSTKSMGYTPCPVSNGVLPKGRPSSLDTDGSRGCRAVSRNTPAQHGEERMTKKPGLNHDQHIALGATLARMQDALNAAITEVGAAYSSNGAEVKALEKVARDLEAARCVMDTAACRTLSTRDASDAYYPTHAGRSGALRWSA